MDGDMNSLVQCGNKLHTEDKNNSIKLESVEIEISELGERLSARVSMSSSDDDSEKSPEITDEFEVQNNSDVLLGQVQIKPVTQLG